MATQFAEKDRVLHNNERGVRRAAVVISAGVDGAVVRYNGKARETAAVLLRDLVLARPSRFTRYRKGTAHSHDSSTNESKPIDQ